MHRRDSRKFVKVTTDMGGDRGAAGAAFAEPILSVGKASRTNKIRG